MFHGRNSVAEGNFLSGKGTTAIDSCLTNRPAGGGALRRKWTREKALCTEQTDGRRSVSVGRFDSENKPTSHRRRQRKYVSSGLYFYFLLQVTVLLRASDLRDKKWHNTSMLVKSIESVDIIGSPFLHQGKPESLWCLPKAGGREEKNQYRGKLTSRVRRRRRRRK